MIEPFGGPGAASALQWTATGVAPNLLLTNGVVVFSAGIPVGACEEIGMHVHVVANGPGLPNATMRLRWSADGTTFYDEVVEEQAALVVGPPAVRQYTLNIKEWGPIVSAVAPGRLYTIIRPVVAHFVAIGIAWSAGVLANDAVDIWLERQGGSKLQGPSS